MVIGNWLLVIGYWLLVIGYWLLVIGYWLLVIVIYVNPQFIISVIMDLRVRSGEYCKTFREYIYLTYLHQYTDTPIY